VLTAGTYVTGAMSLLGAVTTHLALMRTTAVMFGQAFLNRFTPANAGGMAMRVRYLQLNGQDTTVAAASVGLTSAASGIMQAIFIVVFFIWGGTSDRLSDFELPDVGTILIVVLAAGLVLSLLLYSRWGRKVVRPLLAGAVTKVRDSFGTLAHDPGKLALLFGGAGLGKLFTIICFWLSVLAFGVDMSFPKAGALYMVANTVGSAVPSPGGVGGIEAALTAVLIGYGVDSATAAGAVLFFRVLTFWLPTLPGYGFLQYTQRKGIV
jgi:glycosyltransferase 2 family protein